MEEEHDIFLKKSLFAGEDAATMLNRVDVDGENAPHGHEFFEIALAASGRGEHISANGRQPLSTGNLIIVRPGAWHGYMHCEHLVVLNCCFDHQLLQRELGWLRENVILNFLLWTGPYLGNRRGVMVVRLFENELPDILAHWEALSQVQNSFHRAETLGRLLILLDRLARSIEELDSMKQQIRNFHPAVMETMRLLETEIEQDWSLGDLAGRSHLNPSYLVRLFKAEIGLAPIAYLNRCRLERAVGLLLHTELPVAEVAAQVGWYDPNLFARRFRAAHGMSPRAYRQRFGMKLAERASAGSPPARPESRPSGEPAAAEPSI